VGDAQWRPDHKRHVDPAHRGGIDEGVGRIGGTHARTHARHWTVSSRVTETVTGAPVGGAAGVAPLARAAARLERLAGLAGLVERGAPDRHSLADFSPRRGGRAREHPREPGALRVT